MSDNVGLHIIYIYRDTVVICNVVIYNCALVVCNKNNKRWTQCSNVITILKKITVTFKHFLPISLFSHHETFVHICFRCD